MLKQSKQSKQMTEMLNGTLEGIVLAILEKEPCMATKSWRDFAEYQPVTSIVNTVRALFEGQPVATGIWIALVWCVGIPLAAYFGSAAVYRRKMK